MTFLSVSAVGKVFRSRRGETIALDGIDLGVAEHEFVSLLGPSGCGKSTLLTIVAGLVEPSSGRVEIAGKPVMGPVTDIGVVFQRDLLFDWRTVLGNVMLQADVRGLDKRATEARARELLARAGLAGFEDHHPWELSGGMRQRVSICRALVHEAPLLLMDEPFGALDALTRDQMASDLQAMWMADPRTVVFVTHNIAEAVLLSDRIVVMSPRPGRVADEIVVDLPRPRTLDLYLDPRFAGYQHRVRQLIDGMGPVR